MTQLIYLSTVDDLVPHLPSSEVVQELSDRADPTQEICAIAVDYAEYTAPNRQHELIGDIMQDRA